MELHQSFGQDFSTVAACQMTFKEIFDKTHGRIHGTASLTGVQGSGSGLGFGTLEYWVRLRVPMDQALRLYKVTDINWCYNPAGGKARHSSYYFCFACKAEARHMYCFSGVVVVVAVVIVGGVNCCRVFAFRSFSQKL